MIKNAMLYACVSSVKALLVRVKMADMLNINYLY